MQPNVGNKDKTIRLAAGIGIIGIGAYMGSWWGALGIVPIATALLRWCPAYAPLGISTCEKDSSCASTCAGSKTGETEESGGSSESGGSEGSGPSE